MADCTGILWGEDSGYAKDVDAEGSGGKHGSVARPIMNMTTVTGSGDGDKNSGVAVIRKKTHRRGYHFIGLTRKFRTRNDTTTLFFNGRMVI